MALPGCGTEPAPPEPTFRTRGCLDVIPIEPRLSLIQARVFTPRCTRDGCHGLVRPSEELQLIDVDVSFTDLVGVSSVQQPERNRVEPFRPEASYLMAKLTGIGMTEQDSQGQIAGVMPLSMTLCSSSRLEARTGRLERCRMKVRSRTRFGPRSR